MAVEYLVIDNGAPRDFVSLRTLVDTLKIQQVDVRDVLTGEVYQLAMWRKEESGEGASRGQSG